MTPQVAALLETGIQGLAGGSQGLFGWIGAKKEYKRNIEAWHMQNAYNAPSAQMERLKEAGLNPALMYGGSPGQATGNASPVPEFKARDAQWQIPSAVQKLQMHQNIAQSKAQVDLVDQQIETQRREQFLKDAQAINYGAQTAEAIQRTARSKFDLGLANELRETSVQAAQENLNQLRFKTMQSHTDLLRSGIGLQKDMATKEAFIQKMKLEVDYAREHLHGAQLANALRKYALMWENEGLGKAPWWIQGIWKSIHDKERLPVGGW